ncbi:regucalcin-like isoform X2 [Coccinella septempunctata]|uniref:regucalcin-like isoform X2 n=1 Tax=Coccinella septempunctata TaxID=41139 RepID=UPI001D0670AB|nr:regucalcin-like isoform X2 [Coccinella septempunctata]
MSSSENDCTCSVLPYKIEAVTPPVQHGEGPHWDPKTNTLYYVDTFNATACRFCPASKDARMTKYELDDRDSIGVIIPVKDNENDFIVTSDRYIYKLHWHTETNNKGTLSEIHFVDEDKDKNQFNDGKADSKGRLWTGTLTREKDLSVSPNGGCLFRFDLGEKVTRHIEDVSISNGIAWSKDNKRFFFTDSQTKKVVVYDFDEEAGTLGDHKVLFDLEEHPELEGIPDGLTIDEKDNLWIALFGGHGIIHVNGKTGKLMNYLKLPATYCTSACFGGPNQEVLFVTTSNFKLKKEEKDKEHLAGSVFAVTDIGVKGPAPYECAL